MIEVKIQEKEISVSGHANYAAFGNDIVCAGITALTQTFIKSIQDLTDDEIQFDIQPGTAYVKYEDLSEKSRTLVDSFFIGICQIADEFPNRVRIV